MAPARVQFGEEGDAQTVAVAAEPRADPPDAGSESDSTASAISKQWGDSNIASDEDEDAEPRHTQPGPVNEVQELAVAGDDLDPGAGDHRGNIGWLCGNWGASPKEIKMRNHIHVTLKKNPCHVLGPCECQKHTEELLREPPEGPKAPRNAPAVAGDASDTLAVAGAFDDRPEFAYLTTRGAEEKSNLIALGAEPGNRLENLLWLREEGGQYTQKRTSGKAKVRAWNRFLIARVHLRRGVGFMGYSHVVMNTHAHFMVAKGAQGLGTTKLNVYFDRLDGFIERFQVDVFMGDLNMALFAIVPALRSRGLTIDTAAWYPWKSAKIGSAMADSCAIVNDKLRRQVPIMQNFA